MKIFPQRCPGVAHVHDLAHQAANVLKQYWGLNDRWSKFVARLAETAAKLRQTRGAHVLPLKVRPKARFMNVGPTLRFAGRVLKLLDAPTPNPRVVEHYRWLHEFRESLAGWNSEQAVAEATVRHVCAHGLNRDTATELQTLCSTREQTPGARDVAAQLQASVRTEIQQARPGESLVGRTEVLESTFGKLKRLEHLYSGDGFTPLCLALGAIVGERSEDQFRAALDAVPKKKGRKPRQNPLRNHNPNAPPPVRKHQNNVTNPG